MTPADDYQKITDRLFYWSAYDSKLKAELSSSAFVEGGNMFLVDPIPLAREALEEMTSFQNVKAVFLTSETHGRAALFYRKHFGCPIWAHPSAQPALLAEGITLDDTYEDHDIVLNACEAIHVPGTKPGETVLFLPSETGVMFVGDALINLGNTGFSFLPDRYSDNPRQSRESLVKLLDYRFERMFFAHGEPLLQGAGDRLEAMLLD
ncbi:MAG: hypothetical protein SFY92_02175 [Verrucomicrobiae bacterium]|nr:hypothetical protein [Verrucomicrobiae bacterium]